MKWAIELPGISGTRVMLTEQIKELIRLIEVEGCRHVVMKETTRLMRSERYGDYRILDIFIDNGVLIHTPNRTWDLRNPDDALMFGIEMGMSSAERVRIRERTHGQRLLLRSAGLCASGSHTLPLGIGYDPERQVYFPITENQDGVNEADLVHRLFELFTSGETNFRRLAEKTGISYYRIASTLSNTAYIGFRTYDETVDPKQNVYNPDDTLRYQVKIKRDPDKIECVPMAGFKRDPILYDTIVSEEIFTHTQRLLAVKREQDWRGSRHERLEDDPFLFRGFLRCAACGSKIVCLPLPRAKYYACRSALGQRRVNKDGSSDWEIPYGTCSSPRVRHDIVDSLLSVVIMEKIADPSFLTDLLSKRCEEPNVDMVRRAENIRAEIVQTECRIRRLRTAWIAGDYKDDRDEYERVKESLARQLHAQRKALTECSSTIQEVGERHLSTLVEAFARWDILPRGDQRRLLDAICPTFKIQILSNGKRGRGAKSRVEVHEFRLNLSAGCTSSGPQESRNEQ
jgi:DNA invertase Pin-like site-specific DNA recombinase